MSVSFEQNRFHTTEGISGYLQCIADPLSSGAQHIPDENVTANVLKTINYAASLQLAGPAGAFLWPAYSMRPNIRHYGYDSVTGTNNYLATILPDQDLSADYYRGRPIASGLEFVANTVASGAFAVQGQFNAITYANMPPIYNTPPNAITQYKADNVNVLGSVPTAEGLVAISPLTDNRNYRVFLNQPQTHTRAVIDAEVLVQDFPTTVIPAGQTIGPAPAELLLFSWRGMYPNSILNPLPYGNIRFNIRGDLNMTTTLVDDETNNVIVRLTTATADPVTYAQVLTVNTLIVPASLMWVGSGGGKLGLQFGCEEYFYTEAELYNLEVFFFTTTPAGYTTGTPIGAVNVTMSFADYYNYSFKEPGVYVTYQSVSTNQQISIGGKSHWEVVPRSELSRNVPTSYHVDDPLKYEAATLTLLSNLGTKFRFLYVREDYQRRVSNGMFYMDDESIVYHASTFSEKFLPILKQFGRSLIKPAISAAGPALGALLGNPGIGSAFSNAGLNLYTGWQGNGSAYQATTKGHRSPPSHGVYRCSTDPDDYVDLRKASDNIKFPSYEPDFTVSPPLPRKYKRRPSVAIDIEDVCELLRKSDNPEGNKRYRNDRLYCSMNMINFQDFLSLDEPVHAVQQAPRIIEQTYISTQQLTAKPGKMNQHLARRLNNFDENQTIVGEMRQRYGAGLHYQFAPAVTSNGGLLLLNALSTAPLRHHGADVHYQNDSYPIGDYQIIPCVDLKDGMAPFFGAVAGNAGILDFLSLIAQAGGTNRLYYTVVPWGNFPSFPIEGRSWEVAAYFTLSGIPTTRILSGSMDPALITSDLGHKTAIAASSDMPLVAFGCEPRAVEELSALMAAKYPRLGIGELATSISSFTPGKTYITLCGALNYSNLNLAMSLCVTDALLTSSIAQRTGVKSEEAAEARRIQAQSVKQQAEGPFQAMIAGKPVEYTLDELLHNVDDMIDEVRTSGYYDEGNPGFGSSKDRFENLMAAKAYKNAVNYYAQVISWVSKNKGAKKGKGGVGHINPTRIATQRESAFSRYAKK